jgi:hypothetical protein
MEKLKSAFRDAYAAFKGAFDTPQMRMKIPGEYADDARRRLREFDELLASYTGPVEQSDDNEVACSSCGLTMGQSRALSRSVASSRAAHAGEMFAEGIKAAAQLLSNDAEYELARKVASLAAPTPVADSGERELREWLSELRRAYVYLDQSKPFFSGKDCAELADFIERLAAKQVSGDANGITEEHRARLSRLRMILGSGQAENGISQDRADLYAEALDALLTTPTESIRELQ